MNNDRIVRRTNPPAGPAGPARPDQPAPVSPVPRWPSFAREDVPWDKPADELAAALDSATGTAPTTGFAPDSAAPTAGHLAPRTVPSPESLFEQRATAAPGQISSAVPASGAAAPFDRPLYRAELEVDDQFISFSPPWEIPPDDELWGSPELDEAAAREPVPENRWDVFEPVPRLRIGPRTGPQAGPAPATPTFEPLPAVEPARAEVADSPSSETEQAEEQPHRVDAVVLAPETIAPADDTPAAENASSAAEVLRPRLVFPDVELPGLEPASEADADDALAPIAADLLLSTPPSNGMPPWSEHDLAAGLVGGYEATAAEVIESVPEPEQAEKLETWPPEHVATWQPQHVETPDAQDLVWDVHELERVGAEVPPAPPREELAAPAKTGAADELPAAPQSGVLGWSPTVRYSSVFGDMFRITSTPRHELAYQPHSAPAAGQPETPAELVTAAEPAATAQAGQPAAPFVHVDAVDWPPVPANLFPPLPELNLAPVPAPEIPIHWPEEPRAQIFWPAGESAQPDQDAGAPAPLVLGDPSSVQADHPADEAGPLPSEQDGLVPPPPERQPLVELSPPAEEPLAEHDPIFTPRDVRFEPRFLLEDVPAGRPRLVFSDPLPDVAPIELEAGPLGSNEGPFARLANQASAFAERIPDRWAISAGPSLAAVTDKTAARELGDIQSPALTVLFAVVVIAAVLLFVYLVTPLLR